MALLDTQKHADTLRKGGVSDRQARVHVRVLHDALLEGVASKSDIKDLRTEIRELRAEIRALGAEMRAENKILAGRIDNLRYVVQFGVVFTALWVPSMIFTAQLLLK